jgi:hypothetical protein
MSDVICPYCFETWPASLAAFRCIGPADDPKCPRIPDPELSLLLGQPQTLKKVVTKSGRFGRPFTPGKGGVLCDCGKRTTPVCPRCHHGLPHAYAEGGDRLIGMVGSKSSGKSHYIAILFHELFEGVGSRYQARVEMLDDDTRDRLRSDLLPRIYDHGVALEGTVTAAVDDRVRRPLGVRLKFASNNQVVNTVFFDTAGEDLINASVIEREARYIGHCGALLLLIDPLQIPWVRDAVGTSVCLPDLVTEPLTVLKNVTALLRRERAVGEPTKLTQPLGIVFSKLDAIRSLFDEGSAVLSEPSVNGSYDAAEARSIGALLRAHVVQWLGPEFDVFVSANYATSNYFGVSALGAQPLNTGELSRDVAPHRVADPLLWILSQWKTIPVST